MFYFLVDAIMSLALRNILYEASCELKLFQTYHTVAILRKRRMLNCANFILLKTHNITKLEYSPQLFQVNSVRNLNQ